MEESSGVQVGPLLPKIAATPTSHDEDAPAIGLLVEVLGFGTAFEPNSVEAHVLNVGQARRSIAEYPREAGGRSTNRRRE
jgi:hypothetical protein